MTFEDRESLKNTEFPTKTSVKEVKDMADGYANGIIKEKK